MTLLKWIDRNKCSYGYFEMYEITIKYNVNLFV